MASRARGRAIGLATLCAVVLAMVGCAGAEAPEIAGGPTEAVESTTTPSTSQGPGAQPAQPASPPVQSPPMPASAGGSPSGARTTGLTIGVGDVLEVDVFGLEELDRKVRVLEDGTISMPLLGSFKVSGLSLKSAEALVARMLSERRLVNDPQVSIFVEEFSSRGVSVQGAVKQPGSYQMIGSRSLLDMIGEAGGLEADHGRSLFVLRRGADGSQHRFEIDVASLVEGRDFSQNIFLLHGDLVMVPQARSVRVYVTGAVTGPGAIQFSSAEGITVLQAITAAGGPTERANLRKVFVNRLLGDGTQKRWRVNVKAIQNGKEEDFPLEPNDTIVVAEWLF